MKKDKFFGTLKVDELPTTDLGSQLTTSQPEPVTLTQNAETNFTHEAITYYRLGGQYIVAVIKFDPITGQSSKVEVLDQYLDRSTAEEGFKINAVRRVFGK